MVEAKLLPREDLLRCKPSFSSWDDVSIYDKNLLATLRLLLQIIEHFSKQGKVLIDLPKAIKVNVITITRSDGNTKMEISSENLIR